MRRYRMSYDWFCLNENIHDTLIRPMHRTRETFYYLLCLKKTIINSNYLTTTTPVARSCVELAIAGPRRFVAPREIIISASSFWIFSRRRWLYVAESRTLCTLDCIWIPLSRGRMHVTMRTKSCTGKRLYEERNRIECNLSPVGYTGRFVARSLSVKLNSRRNFTRYTRRGIPSPEACSPVVSLYSRPAKKEMPMGLQPATDGDEPSSFRRLSPPSLASTCLHSASCSFMFRPDGRWNLLISRSQFRGGFVPSGRRSRFYGGHVNPPVEGRARHWDPFARDNIDQGFRKTWCFDAGAEFQFVTVNRGLWRFFKIFTFKKEWS